MQASLLQSAHSAVSLGKSHGYRFEGDTAILTAELALGAAERDAARGFALQLWACEEPYRGGQLRGIKVAEAELALPHAVSDATQLETAASAQLPPAQREYAMVLVLASGAAGVYDQVHDFSNYPLRQGFTGPHLEGNVGYRFVEGGVVLQAERIRNPRAESNLSGTLALELWALSAPYEGGGFSGIRLAQAELGQVAGQTHSADVERLAPLYEPGVGAWQLTLMLREWTAAFGYVTRDYCNFAELHRVVSPGASAQQERQSADDRDRSFVSADTVRSEESWTSELVAPTPSGSNPLAEALRQSADEPLTLDTRADEPAAAPSAGRPAAPTASEQEASAGVAEPAPTAPVVEVAQAVEPTLSPAVPAAVVAKVAPAAVEKRATSAEPVAALERVRASAQPAPSSPQGSRVSVQQASLDELAAVPGLNKKLAAAIVRGRPFKTLDDLTRIRGIGDKILQRLRPYLTL